MFYTYSNKRQGVMSTPDTYSTFTEAPQPLDTATVEEMETDNPDFVSHDPLQDPKDTHFPWSQQNTTFSNNFTTLLCN